MVTVFPLPANVLPGAESEGCSMFLSCSVLRDAIPSPLAGFSGGGDCVCSSRFLVQCCLHFSVFTMPLSKRLFSLDGKTCHC